MDRVFIMIGVGVVLLVVSLLICIAFKWVMIETTNKKTGKVRTYGKPKD